MSDKNFMSYDNAEEVLGAFADEINGKTPVTRMTVGSSDGHVIQFETDRAYGDVLVSISSSVSGIKELYLLSSMGDGGYSRTKVTRLAKGINGNVDSRIKFYVSSTSGVYTIWADATYSSIANERLFVSVVQLGEKSYTLSKLAALPADAIAARFADNANPAFTGTLAEWNALQDYEKAAYDLVNITDDGESGDVVDAVTDGDMSPVTSNAVYDYVNGETTIPSSEFTIPEGWTFGSEFVCKVKNGVIYVCGSIYTSGEGIAKGSRLTMPYFFPSNAHPRFQSAYVLGGASGYGNALSGIVTAYHPDYGRTLYVDNVGNDVVKQIYFNISALL